MTSGVWFVKTLTNSSLGARMVALHLGGVVPAFHGHAHNRSCQVHWHPRYTEGVGLEDFEECEHTFYKSNKLASITQLATPFHRHQQIDEHFFSHDLDKHAAAGMCHISTRQGHHHECPSGNFIFQNYRQALE